MGVPPWTLLKLPLSLCNACRRVSIEGLFDLAGMVSEGWLVADVHSSSPARFFLARTPVRVPTLHSAEIGDKRSEVRWADTSSYISHISHL
jgi:hypothetical protein